MDDVSWVFKLRKGDRAVCARLTELSQYRHLMEDNGLVSLVPGEGTIVNPFYSQSQDPLAQFRFDNGSVYWISPQMLDPITRDAVDHPSHYGSADDPYETIKVLERWLTRDEFIGFLKGNILKYTGRAGKKSGEPAEKDHAKSAWYDNYLTEFLKRSPK